ncbi:MAG: quinohemoprotein ethanol dehydrogenase [Candidatus Azotimanducaceae bacterium]|jgi:quinohemoprotein ethanol dehydrogenase
MRFFTIAMLLFLVAGCDSGSQETPVEALSDVAWPKHGLTSGEARYSELSDINQENIGELGIAWTYELDSTRGVETTPIVVDGVMYVTEPWSIVHAIDPTTGEQLWRYDPKVPRQWGRWACCDVVNRGVAVWKNKVIFGSLDGRLIALDRATGELAWEVRTTPTDKAYTITGAPRIAGDLVVIGNGGAEYGVRGYITAFNPENGEQAWRFYMVPGDPNEPLEHPDLAMTIPTWTGEWWKVGGGGTAWDSMAYDKELGLLYVGVGNGSPWSRSERSPGGGDNLFLSSIVAINVSTGRYAWHYQTTPGDNWDYTATQHIVLTELEWGGEQRKVLMQAPKNGFLYVIDRTNGELLSAAPYVDMNWASHVDIESGRPIETEKGDYRSEMKRVTPGPQGGHNWQPMSFSKNSGLLYIPAHDTAFDYHNDEAFTYDPATWNLGIKFDQRFIDAAITSPPIFRGFLIAWDPIAGSAKWQRQLSGHWNGGLLSTAGGLVFQGTADGLFTAYNDADGEPLWQTESSTGFFAPPVTYRAKGEQYVVIAAGVGGGGMGALIEGAKINEYHNEGRIIAFKRGGDKPMPVSKKRDLRPPPMPDIEIDQSMIVKGGEKFNTYCAVCHGLLVMSSNLFPDLRYLSADKHAIFKQIVIEGAFINMGMPSFGDVLTAEDARAIQMYVLDNAKLMRAPPAVLTAPTGPE